MPLKTTAHPLTIFLIYNLFFPTPCNANSNIDSLLAEIQRTNDTMVFESYYLLIGELLESPDSALLYANEAMELAISENNKKQIGVFHSQKGIVFERMGRIIEAVDEFQKAYDAFIQIDETKNAVRSLTNLGAMLVDNSKFEEASIHLFKSLKLAEENNLDELKAGIYLNIGLLFYNQQEYEKSIDYYTKTIPIRKKYHNLKGLALTYNNIGISYYYLNMFDSVLVNFERSLEMYIQLGDKLGQTRPLSNIGEIYYTLGDYDKALEHFNESLEIEKEIGYKSGYAVSLFGIGDLYAEIQQFDKALEYQYEGLKVTKELGSEARIMDGYNYLYGTYNKLNQSDSALKYFVLYSRLKDSLFTLEKINNINELEKIYETEKKEQQIALQQAVIQNHKKQSWTLSVILVLILGIVVQILRINRNKRKTNEILEEKNRKLAENNKQITSSITYASFIQAAILPPLELFKEVFPENFVLFKPKDIVSGDFYWTTRKEDKIILAVADCTGHGVRGAFMSMLGITYLNEAINIQNINSPAKVLNEMRTKVIGALRQRSSHYDTRDGMDIALCSIDLTTYNMEFSGAYNSILVHSKGKIERLQGDKMPIGYHKTRRGDFQVYSRQLKKGDHIYMYSDGYIDQFGGDEGKKYSRQRLVNFIQSIVEYPLSRQEQKLDIEFKNWKGSRDQIDDVTVLGVRI